MARTPATKDIGLRGVLVADTRICLIDGVNGKLFYRGYDIRELAERSTYEEVAYLLLYGNLPDKAQLSAFSKNLAEEREIPRELIDLFCTIPKTISPMELLQSAVALLGGFDPERAVASREVLQKRGTRLIAKIPTVVASWDRVRRGLDPVTPKKDLSQAQNFLWMLKGEIPKDDVARDFDVCLILHAEHSFNASTFAARVVSSTRASIYASVAAAIGALSGELHGGANSRVMKSLLEIGEPDKVQDWVRARLNQDKRIMGMGHAIYKTTDPRAKILKHISERMADSTKEPKWYLITRNIEDITKKEFLERKGKSIFANVDLYSASVYYMMGIPADLFTPVFAVSRIAGWAAHIVEERFPEQPVKPVLYRPASEYMGNYCGPIGCKFVPLEDRNRKR